MPRHYCASCTLARVRFANEYCDACIQDIIDYLEEDEAAYLMKINAKQHNMQYGELKSQDQLGFSF